MNVRNLTAFSVCLAVFGCAPLSGPNNSISSQYSIHLSGRVLDNNGSPMANTVVKLKSRCLSDTTDAKGCYCLSEKKNNTTPKLPDPCKDSLEYCKDSQTITKKSIPNWIDTLPDLYTIQRDIYGGLTSVPQSFGMIIATITGADSIPQIAQLWYNVQNQSYSGFVYFVYSADVVNYSVCVSVYNTSGVLTGRSVIVTFPSKTAGDINMPGFDPNNACARKDTTVDTVKHDTVNHTTVSFGGPVAWWTFDSGSGNTFYDVTGHGYDASWTGTGITTAKGVKGQALSCPGSGFEITVAHSLTNFDFAKFSIVTWCYSNTDYSQNTDAVKIFDHQSIDGSGGIRNGYSIHVDPNGQIVFGLANSDGSEWMCARSSTLLKGQTWYFITCTYDSSVLRIYLNGLLDATCSYAGTYVKPTYDARIACQRRTDGSVRYLFNGKIDEMKIYNYALPADSILAQYHSVTLDTVTHDTVTHTQSPFGPVAWWSFDSVAGGNTFNDITGHGFNASWTGTGIGITQGVRGQSLSCPGSGFEITVANSLNNLDFTKFSIETWCYSNTDYSQNAEAVKIFDHQSVPGSGGLTDGYTIHVDPNGQIVFAIGSSDGSFWPAARSSTLLKGQTWYYITCTYDSSALRIYLNGTLDATYSYQGTYIRSVYDARIACQRRLDGTVRYLDNGKIDELKIYDYPLSADTVLAHYRSYNFIH